MNLEEKIVELEKRLNNLEQNKHPDLKYYKLYDDVQDLKFATKGSVCFDASAYLKDGEIVKYYNKYNKEDFKVIVNNHIFINPQERVLIPTGIILDITEGYSVRTHPRSSTGLKLGLSHPHNEGKIDSDYYHELFMLFINLTESIITIEHNQKLAQLEMVRKLDYNLVETKIKPEQKTDRIGGFGSTNIN